ncbi:MAG: hypothetical protein OXU72_10690, partial [Gammaproteobacteria bacterium]|nr:hypothetical protein [Gammaproteobacteria bacterium]
MLRIILLSFVLLLAACTGPPAEFADPTKLMLPVPSGPHALGVVDFELTDNAREETFAPGTPRRIPVRAWYPASSVSGEPRLFATAEEVEHVIRGFNNVIPQSEAVVASRADLPTH